MRAFLSVAVCVSTALGTARGQHATVTGRVVARESGEPVGAAAISVLPRGTPRLAGESGAFVLRDLPPGEVRLRFRRIGFAPVDTALVVGANDTAQVRIEMSRLAIQLPAVVVNGTCTDGAPFAAQPAILAALFDQVRQNAERLRLLAIERPFVMKTVATGGFRDRDDRIVGGARVDTVERGPLPPTPYAPRKVVFRFRDEKTGSGAWGVTMPELSDLADTAFTNNHCFWYAGQERMDRDSVIRVDFEPVPWLARERDLSGSIYLRVDDYLLVAMMTRLTRLPPGPIREYYTRARFRELVSGVPVLATWELINTYAGQRPPYRYVGKVTAVRWVDSVAVRRDTLRRPW
jgi:hypothetical protein